MTRLFLFGKIKLLQITNPLQIYKYAGKGYLQGIKLQSCRHPF